MRFAGVGGEHQALNGEMSGFAPGLVDGFVARHHHGTRWIHALPDSIVVLPKEAR